MKNIFETELAPGGVAMNNRPREFLATLAHEMRNPLAVLQQGLEVLNQVPSDSDERLRVQRVMTRQVAQLSRLVEDIAEFSRMSYGKISLRKEVFDLVAWVRTFLEDGALVLAKAQLSLAAKLPADPVWVCADALRLRQVVDNLLHNAEKFTPPGGQVVVTLQPKPPHVFLSVRDTGRGLEPWVLSELFEPFFQAQPQDNRESKGLGLGLALVKMIVEQHGGTVTAHSEGLNLGAEFQMKLPLVPPPENTLSAKRPKAPPKTLRLLVVEDNRDLAQMLCEVLSMEGHSASWVSTGKAALEKATQVQPDVVFCDIGLPDLNGYELAKAFRQHDSLKHVHLVAFSGYAEVDDILLMKQAGFSAHLSKPPSLEAIAEVLKKLMA